MYSPASVQIANGANIPQLSRALGLHSPGFTLAVYALLLPGEEAPALDLGEVLRVNAGVNTPSGESTESLASARIPLHADLVD